MSKLESLVLNLSSWQIAEDEAGRKRANRCGEAMRVNCKAAGLGWPQKGYAIQSFEALAADPAKHGWQRVSPMQPGLQLVFFKQCGKLSSGVMAGHASLVWFWRDAADKLHGVLFGNVNYKWSKYWQDRVVGAFKPDEEVTE